MVLVQRAPRLQRLQQYFLVLQRYSFVEFALLRDLGEQFRDMPLEVGLDIADPLRLAAERMGRVKQRIVIELDEGLQRDAEPLAIIQHGAMMIGNPPRTRVEIEALLKSAGLGR